MTTSAEDIDFKPFFDMVVGILFILLILISAQIFFAQHTTDDASQEAERRALERERQTTAFLEDFTGRLRAEGFEARIDRSRRAVVMPLGGLMDAGRDSVPQFAGPRVSALASVLAERLPCIAPQPLARAACADVDLLNLGSVEAEVRIAAAPERSPLSADRYAQLATTLFSSALLQLRPALLGLSNLAGTPALRFSAATQAAAARQAALGELSFTFVFQPR